MTEGIKQAFKPVLLCVFSILLLPTGSRAAAEAFMTDRPCPAPPAAGGGQRAPETARGLADLCHFQADNALVLRGPAPAAVFMGDSITEAWGPADPALFSHGVIDRGISGQTSPQMLLRFYQDVVLLHPRVVHLLAGTNDVAGNSGPSSPEEFANNIRAMSDLARAHHIQVIVASILPAERFPWRPRLEPAAQIRQLNDWLRQYAAEQHWVFADYYTALATPAGAMRPELSSDGVHPNAAGYAVMRPIAERALRDAQAH